MPIEYTAHPEWNKEPFREATATRPHGHEPAFSTTSGSDIPLTVDNSSALEHRPEIPDYGFEELGEVVTAKIVRHDDNLPYDLDDLLGLLAKNKRLHYAFPDDSDNLFAVPDREDIVLRCTYGDTQFSTPPTPEKLAARMHKYEQRLRSLGNAGLQLLPHSSFVIEHATANDNRLAIVYTPTLKLADHTTLDIRNTELNAKASRIVAEHLINHTRANPAISDLANEFQFHSSGTLLDYDPYFVEDITELLGELDAVRGWVERWVSASPRGTDPRGLPILHAIETKVHEIRRSYPNVDIDYSFRPKQ